jgi:glucose-6-phosphate isomerase
MDNNFNWQKGFTIDFDMISGLSNKGTSTKRKLSQMKGMYYDHNAYKNIMEQDDPVVYEFYELGCPESAGDIAFGTSITYPGKVGDEYFFTKGHFHTILETAEVYYCLSGEGYMLIENPEGDWDAIALTKGEAVYVPKSYAHRSINTGTTPLVTFFAFRGDAGHNYGTIEEKGYRKLIIEKNGKPEIIDNPNW